MVQVSAAMSLNMPKTQLSECMSPSSNVGNAESDSGALNPLKLLHFEISDHEILKREDYVVSIRSMLILIIWFIRFLIIVDPIINSLSLQFDQISNNDTHIYFCFFK